MSRPLQQHHQQVLGIIGAHLTAHLRRDLVIWQIQCQHSVQQRCQHLHTFGLPRIFGKKTQLLLHPHPPLFGAVAGLQV